MLDEVRRHLGWPSSDQIWSPLGHGPSVFARLAREKIGFAVKRLPEGKKAKIGILAENPLSESTETPLAVVCDFQQPVSRETLIEVHKLAWNFCRSPLLFTIEPEILRAWTCWEQPDSFLDQGEPSTTPVAEVYYDPKTASFIPEPVASTLHWIRLVTGEFFEKHKDRFKIDQRADHVLLRNLAFVRDELASQSLPEDIVHDLLARLIFVQLLRQRTDRTGTPALDDELLAKLSSEGILSRGCQDLGTILSTKEDTYNLFRWLNERFNGDLFPGKGGTEEEREAEWRNEMALVHVKHLQLLSEFVRGDLRMDDNQRSLWPLYSFNAIPLEFISSIYEEFVSKSAGAVGAHYTPGHVVDFILDRVLPWSGDAWDIKVLDPSCGSGIFLVKAFQRLVHRWRRAHPGKAPGSELLRRLLRNNLFGVDINPHAIRVASFSLYLAMCDEIDPKKYWTEVSFPRLRNGSLITSDFFDSTVRFCSDGGENCRFDLVVGNAPWGKNSLSEAATAWALENDWPVVHKEIGTLFLSRALDIVADHGKISMLQPSGAVLFNKSHTAVSFRKKIFACARIEEIVDLSALRLSLFPNSSSPVCLVTLTAEPPEEGTVIYCHPAPGDLLEYESRLVMEPYNIHEVSLREAVEDPWVWTALAWGGRRDLALLRRIANRAEDFVTLLNLKEREGWKGREGFKRGDKKRRKPELADGTYAVVGPKDIRPFKVREGISVNLNDHFHSRDSTDDSIFKGPLLLIPKSWRVGSGFCAAIFDGNAIFPASSMYGLHFPEHERSLAEAACFILNSSFAEWFLSLTSGRAASYRPEVLAEELLRMPICRSSALTRILDKGVGSLNAETPEDVARQLLGIKDTEWTLIEDFHEVTVVDFRKPDRAVGRSRPGMGVIRDYCRAFIRVLRAGFGGDKKICATIFQEEGAGLSVRMVAFHLGYSGKEEIVEANLSDESLMEILESKARLYLTQQERGAGGIFHQRVAKVYGDYEILLRDTADRLSVPTVYFIKPDQLRYWTKSAALRDADAVAADILGSRESGDDDSGAPGYLM